MRFGRVRSVGDDRLEGTPVRPQLLVNLRHALGQAFLRIPLREQGDDSREREVVQAGCFPHQLPFVRVLPHAKPVENRGGVDEVVARPHLHQSQEKTGRPGLVNPHGALAVQRPREQLHPILVIVDPDLLHAQLFRDRKQLIDEQRMTSGKTQAQRQHSLAGVNPLARQVVDGRRIGHDHLRNAVIRHLAQHTLEPVRVHRPPRRCRTQWIVTRTPQGRLPFSGSRRGQAAGRAPGRAPMAAPDSSRRNREESGLTRTGDTCTVLDPQRSKVLMSPHRSRVVFASNAG